MDSHWSFVPLSSVSIWSWKSLYKKYSCIILKSSIRYRSDFPFRFAKFLMKWHLLTSLQIRKATDRKQVDRQRSRSLSASASFYLLLQHIFDYSANSCNISTTTPTTPPDSHYNQPQKRLSLHLRVFKVSAAAPAELKKTIRTIIPSIINCIKIQLFYSE